MTDIDRMVVWLRETMDAAEQIARAARLDGAGHWQHHGYVSGADVSGDHDGYHVACDEGYPTLEQAQHIALNDPHSVLLRVAAERKQLELHRAEPGQHPDYCGYDKHELPCPGLRLLAEGYGWTEETT